MNTSEKKFSILCSNRIVKAFWTLNEEMKPAYKVTFVREIDASAMDRLRQNILRQTSVKPSYTAFVIKAAAMALQEYPYANRALLGFSFWKRFVQFNRFDITVAVERNVPNAESVVLADTILECDKKSLADLTGELVALSNATEDSNPRWRLFYSLLSKVPVYFSKWLIRLPRLFPSMWATHRGGACFVNSPAKYGIDFFIGDMLWPLTVTFGWVKERPIAIDGRVEVRRTVPLGLIFDRRIMAGAPAARFFTRIAYILEHADEEIIM
ncbi:2-oxo acid dehydrogenase subunit E2 [Geobacter grbiciae]|uniref:2-oxo acid dehydrogenase subunit E2 n=1 Tax=Geobacter grbiciae TaxID=155042 RepID=UPI001C01D30C|nr:2-oxo acid dehydrogenase subunit E2 [Geobacter grbiciae]MBT1074688.1 2-oxo acid dehydrogenase subunit E2 [Geobacter grbiciae]